jgi:hypothetical protein
MSTLATESRGKLCRSAMKLQHGTLAGQPDNLYILPGYAATQSCPNGFHSGFLGGKAGGQTLCGVGLTRAVADLGGCENTIQKTAAKALYRSFNPAYFGNVNSSPYNHLGIFAKVSYRWLRVSKPRLI